MHLNITLISLLQDCGGLRSNLLRISCFQDSQTSFHRNVFSPPIRLHLLQSQSCKCFCSRGRCRILHIKKCCRRRELASLYVYFLSDWASKMTSSIMAASTGSGRTICKHQLAEQANCVCLPSYVHFILLYSFSQLVCFYYFLTTFTTVGYAEICYLCVHMLLSPSNFN